MIVDGDARGVIPCEDAEKREEGDRRGVVRLYFSSRQYRDS